MRGAVTTTWWVNGRLAACAAALAACSSSGGGTSGTGTGTSGSSSAVADGGGSGNSGTSGAGTGAGGTGTGASGTAVIGGFTTADLPNCPTASKDSVVITEGAGNNISGSALGGQATLSQAKDLLTLVLPDNTGGVNRISVTAGTNGTISAGGIYPVGSGTGSPRAQITHIPPSTSTGTASVCDLDIGGLARVDSLQTTALGPGATVDQATISLVGRCGPNSTTQLPGVLADSCANVVSAVGGDAGP
jgi:hypothetical protein